MGHNQQPAQMGNEMVLLAPELPPTNIDLSYETDKPRDECGVFGILAFDRPVGAIAWQAGLAQEHRGLSGSGIAYRNPLLGEMQIEKGTGAMEVAIPYMKPQVDILAPPDSVFSTLALVHNRYGTAGNRGDLLGTQPIKEGDVTVAHNGHLDMASLHRMARQFGVDPTTAATDSHLLTMLIGKHVSITHDIKLSLTQILPHVKGAFCLTIAYNNMLIGVRDNRGVHPLSVGKIAGGGGVVASETVALQPEIVGELEWMRDVEAGEMVFVTRDGIESHRFTDEDVAPKHCLFESIYTASEASTLWGTDVQLSRYNMGKALAEVAPVEADLVIGVLNSGIPSGKGYAEASGIAYAQAIQKRHGVTRTFILDGAARDAMLDLKYEMDEAALVGQRIIVTDDSMIKGNSMRKLVPKLKAAGATEIHLRFAGPRFESICNLGIDAGRLDELIASPGKLDILIAVELGVDSVAFNSVENVERAIDAARVDPRTASLLGSFCHACTLHDYHDTVPDEVQRARQQKTGLRILALTKI